MESHLFQNGLRRFLSASRCPGTARSRRGLATLTDALKPADAIRAATPITFTGDRNQFARRRPSTSRNSKDSEADKLLQRVRIVPASPSYFTGYPKSTDDLLHLSQLLRKYQTLPVLPAAEAPLVYWKTIDQYKAGNAETVRIRAFSEILALLKRLNCIHPSVFPAEVTLALARYKRTVQPQTRLAKRDRPNESGFAHGTGRRKTSVATVTIVEGDGQCLINGKSLSEYFGRIHDRESALWALKATARMSKYNVWAVVQGGGTTGQAEAITLGVANALLIHEPALKPALRRAGVVTRNPKRVERKKAGKLKSRKMPAWVKR